MIKKTVTYVDYNGDTRTEDAYFHLTKTELRELEWSVSGGLVATLNALLEDPEKNVAPMMQVLKKIIIAAYGIKSDDGRRFEKNYKLSEEFEHSALFEAIFDEILEDADGVNAFISGMLPANPSVQLNAI